MKLDEKVDQLYAAICAVFLVYRIPMDGPAGSAVSHVLNEVQERITKLQTENKKLKAQIKQLKEQK